MDEPVKRVLIVASDEAIARMVMDALVPLGLEVTRVSSAEAAMESVLKQMPDLVLADFNLPGRNGVDLLAELGVAHGQAPSRVLLSAPDAPLPRRWGLDIPVLSRPFRAQTLQWLVQSLIPPPAVPAL